MSPRLPMGVLTRNSVPARAELTSTLASPRSGRVLRELLREGGLADESDHLIHELSVFEKQDRRNRANVELRRRLDVRIHVHLRDLRLALVLGGELIENGSNHAAGRAPGRPEIHHGKPLVILDLGLEI